MNLLLKTCFGILVFTLCVEPCFAVDTDMQTRTGGQSVQGARVSFATWQRKSKVIQAQPGHFWRETPDGWIQVPMSDRPKLQHLVLPPQRPVIHPISVASMMLLLVLAAMAWASSEWDWQRFIRALPLPE